MSACYTMNQVMAQLTFPHVTAITSEYHLVAWQNGPLYRVDMADIDDDDKPVTPRIRNHTRPKGGAFRSF